MTKEPLTFAIVDDLVAARMRGRLKADGSGARFAPRGVGPLIELMFDQNDGRCGPLLQSRLLDLTSQTELRAALAGPQDTWLDKTRNRGFLRTTLNPSADEHETDLMRLLMAARTAAEGIGFPIATAQCLTAAIREMESNVYEHSGRAQTGIIAFQAGAEGFEFVVADSGFGILETLREAPEFAGLNDHGRALHAALQEGVSRYGRESGHGMGFRDLFRGLSNLNADLRFRSGDHALTISGPRPELKSAQLSQKSPFQGFLVSVHCRHVRHSNATH